MGSPLLAPTAVMRRRRFPNIPTPSPFFAWNSSIVFWLYAVALMRRIYPSAAVRLRQGVGAPFSRFGPCSTKARSAKIRAYVGGVDGLFLWLLFRHPLGIAALGLGLRILRPLLRLVAAFLHVGLRVVDHLISPPTVEIRKPASSSTITSGRRATQTFERLTGDFPQRPGGKGGPRNPSRPRRKRCRAEKAAVARSSI